MRITSEKSSLILYTSISRLNHFWKKYKFIWTEKHPESV